MKYSQLSKLFLLKAKYAAASALATSLDYGLYFVLVYTCFGEDQIRLANFISYPVGVLANFFLQKRYIFRMERKLGATFAGAMAVSAGGWALNTALFFFLTQIQFFTHWHILAKLLVNGCVFFYNFYGKRFVFEKRFFDTE